MGANDQLRAPSVSATGLSRVGHRHREPRAPIYTGLVFDNNLVRASERLSTSPSFREILWNFSRYRDRARITLEQNPHFYLSCPADESAYTPMFRRYPLQDPSRALEHNDTVYVLFDGPGRVFLDTERKLRIFPNVWSLNGSLIFRGSHHVSPSRFLLSDVLSDRSGVLEGEQLVRGSSIRGNLWYCDQQVVLHGPGSRYRLNHRCLRPIVTISSADRSAREISEDWTALNRLASCSINTHTYGSRGSPGSINTLVCFDASIYFHPDAQTSS